MIRKLPFALFLFCGLFNPAFSQPDQPSQSTPSNPKLPTPPWEPTMDVFLWFDTEDYLLPASDDAALRLANLLTQEGVRATFKLVGEKARTLERRGRHDVINALKRHEIGYHSNWHSVHPTPAQYLSALGWEEGVAEFVRREGPGVEDVTRIFGQHPSCYGQPGSSWGPQAFGAMRRLGIPVYLDAGSHVNLDNQPLWYDGILTIFSLEYTLRTGLRGKKDLKEAKEKFSAARQQVLSRGGGAVHIYYHPCEWVHQQFWDGVNFSNGANPPPEMWKLPAQQTPPQTETAFETFLAYLRWMKQQPGVRFLTARDGLTLYGDRAQGHAFNTDELEQMAAAIGDSISFQHRGDFSVSPAELFTLLNARVAAYSDKANGEQSYTLSEAVFWSDGAGAYPARPADHHLESVSAHRPGCARLPIQARTDAFDGLAGQCGCSARSVPDCIGAGGAAA